MVVLCLQSSNPLRSEREIAPVRRTIAQEIKFLYKKYIPDFLNLNKGMALFYWLFACKLARSAFDADPRIAYSAMVL
jgi:hypothetical protein